MNEVETRIHSEWAFISRNFWVIHFQFGVEVDWCGLGNFLIFQVYYFVILIEVHLVIIILKNQVNFSKIGCLWCWCSHCWCFGSFELSGRMFFFWWEIRRVTLILKHDFIFYLLDFSLERFLRVFLWFRFVQDSLKLIIPLQTMKYPHF